MGKRGPLPKWRRSLSHGRGSMDRPMFCPDCLECVPDYEIELVETRDGWECMDCGGLWRDGVWYRESTYPINYRDLLDPGHSRRVSKDSDGTWRDSGRLMEDIRFPSDWTVSPEWREAAWASLSGPVETRQITREEWERYFPGEPYPFEESVAGA